MTFKRRENELREKDLKIQESLIKFSKYLEENEMKKKKADERKKAEEKEIALKKAQTDDLQKQLKELTNKSERIDKKNAAMKKYEDFLKFVKEQNSDDFTELSDIVNRFNTLDDSNKKLQEGVDALNKNKEKITTEMTQYIREKKTQIMTITNEIGERQKDLENIEETKGKIQSNSEEMKSKRIQGTSEIGNIIMSIDNLLSKCQIRNTKKATYSNVDAKFKNFDDLNHRGQHALTQLDEIQVNISDMQTLIEKIQKHEANEGRNSS